MAAVALRIKSTLTVAVAALVLLGAASVHANKASATGQRSNSWTTKYGVKFETRSTDWRPGKKAEWERRITGAKPGAVTKINGESWGSKVKGTARTFKNGNAIERLTYTSTTGEVRKVTTRTLKDGTVIKTIKLADKSSREITSWVDRNVEHTRVIEKDPQGNVLSTKTDSRDQAR
jgi:hypothetical protein